MCVRNARVGVTIATATHPINPDVQSLIGLLFVSFITIHSCIPTLREVPFSGDCDRSLSVRIVVPLSFLVFLRVSGDRDRSLSVRIVVPLSSLRFSRVSGDRDRSLLVRTGFPRFSESPSELDTDDSLSESSSESDSFFRYGKGCRYRVCLSLSVTFGFFPYITLEFLSDLAL